MSSPVEMPDLPPATIANDDDETVLRQGMTDYRCAVGLLRSINVQGLSPLSLCRNRVQNTGAGRQNPTRRNAPFH